jgi:hypothetical protein
MALQTVQRIFGGDPTVDWSVCCTFLCAPALRWPYPVSRRRAAVVPRRPTADRALFKYAPDLRLAASGTGTSDDFVDELGEGDVLYGYLRTALGYARPVPSLRA